MKLNDILTRHGVIKKRGAAEEIHDFTNAPGPKTLIAGDMDAGFFGEVSPEELIDGISLASLAAYSKALPINNDSHWFKFILDGEILFQSKYPLRAQSSTAQGPRTVYPIPNRKVIIDGVEYNLTVLNRLNPAFTCNKDVKPSDQMYQGSEWERIMLPMFAQSADQSWSNTKHLSGDVPNWGMYTPEDLRMDVGDKGNHIIFREICDRGAWGERLSPTAKGPWPEVGEWVTVTSRERWGTYGWYPVLRVMEENK